MMTVRSLDARQGRQCFLVHEPGRKQIAEHLREHVGEEPAVLLFRSCLSPRGKCQPFGA